MYNVIFYDKVKEITEAEDVIVRQYQEDGTYTDTIEVREVPRKYRVPTKFVFETATSCDKFLQGFTILDDFKADMPSLNSAVAMFENSSVTSISGEGDGVANFQSLTSADRMFAGCKQLTSINIDASSLVTVEDFVEGCESLISFSGSLSSLVNGKGMFSGFTPLNNFNAELNSLEDGTDMFRGTSLTVFSPALPAIENASSMFAGTPIISFNLNCPDLIIGDSMFEDCTDLTSVAINLPALKSGDYMFKNTSISTCTLNTPELKYAEGMFSGASLVTFSGDLSHLINGDNMFGSNTDNNGARLISFDVKVLDNLETANNMMGAVQFTKWDIDMPSLTSAINMFSSYTILEDEILYPALETFESDLQSLVNGTGMFKDCVNLQHFNAPLPSLKHGNDIFTNCKLDAESVMYIAESLSYYPEAEAKFITIGINCASSDADKFFASTGVYKDLADFKKRMWDKGWNLTLRYNPID